MRSFQTTDSATRMIAKNLKGLLIVTSMLLGSGCMTTSPNAPVYDPLEPLNRQVLKLNEAVDSYALKPLARGYKQVVPDSVRGGIRNVFSNINDVNVAINSLLQGKFTQAGSDAARFMLNTTAGLGGIFDVATEVGLVKHQEDFGQTLAEWGVPEGPYVVLPIFGPSSLRDTARYPVDYQLSVYSQLDSAQVSALTALDTVEWRAQFLDAEDILNAAAIDRYIFIRDGYMLRRRSLVDRYHNQPHDALDGIEQNLHDRDLLDELDAIDGNGSAPPPDELDLIDQLD